LEKFFYDKLLPRTYAKKDTTKVDSLPIIDIEEVDRLQIGTSE
jgi:hypothetical protein